MRVKRGFTLVETLVALAVFLIAAGAAVAAYTSCAAYVKRRMDYSAFEGICLDIGFYGDRYGAGWAEEYFNGALTYTEGGETLCYYGGEYSPVDSLEEAEYILSYRYEDGALVVSVGYVGGKAIISELNYGPARYDNGYLAACAIISQIKVAPYAESEESPAWATALFFGQTAARETDGDKELWAYSLDGALSLTDGEPVYKLYYEYEENGGVYTLYVSIKNVSGGYYLFFNEPCGVGEELC